MGLRKASAYSKIYARPYTRKSRVRNKSYIKAVPPIKTVKYFMGRGDLYRQGKLPFTLIMVSDEKFVQIRDNALESCRMAINKYLDTKMPGQYYFQIKTYTHHIQRENKMLTGAGADRMSTGMQLSFGKAMGRAAILKKGHPIFVISTQTKKNEQEARKILHIIKSKLPCTTRILSEDTKVPPMPTKFN